MKYALVNALNAEKRPLYIDGEIAGMMQAFDIPRNVVVLRVPDGTTITQQQKLAAFLRKTIVTPVLIVGPNVEFLVLETKLGRWVRLFRQRLVGFWLTLRSKFALFDAKS